MPLANRRLNQSKPIGAFNRHQAPLPSVAGHHNESHYKPVFGQNLNFFVTLKPCRTTYCYKKSSVTPHIDSSSRYPSSNHEKVPFLTKNGTQTARPTYP
jgi:hypothetical protein